MTGFASGIAVAMIIVVSAAVCCFVAGYELAVPWFLEAKRAPGAQPSLEMSVNPLGVLCLGAAGAAIGALRRRRTES